MDLSPTKCCGTQAARRWRFLFYICPVGKISLCFMFDMVNMLSSDIMYHCTWWNIIKIIVINSSKNSLKILILVIYRLGYCKKLVFLIRSKSEEELNRHNYHTRLEIKVTKFYSRLNCWKEAECLIFCSECTTDSAGRLRSLAYTFVGLHPICFLAYCL